MRQRVVDLCRDSADRYGFGQGIFPKIAHQAAPGALAVGEDKRRDWYDFSGCRPLVFYKESVWAQRIKTIPDEVRFGTAFENPFIAVRLCFWIGSLQGTTHWYNDKNLFRYSAS